MSWSSLDFYDRAPRHAHVLCALIPGFLLARSYLRMHFTSTIVPTSSAQRMSKGSGKLFVFSSAILLFLGAARLRRSLRRNTLRPSLETQDT